MSNIKNAFSKGKAFIPFITCGQISLDITEKTIYEMEKNGANLIELGIPFSDPVAEGSIIQSANNRALKNGTTTDKIFSMVESVRKNTDIPMVFMTYANIVFSYGIDRFAEKSKKLKIDGIILPDVPYEEKKEFDSIFKNHNIDFISLIAPTSEERISAIAKDSNGFIYCVSSLGVTGIRKNINTNIEKMVNLVKSVNDIPVAVGFGISTPKQAKEMSKYADGVIVGSAIVKLCEEYGEDSPSYVGKYVKEMKNAIL